MADASEVYPRLRSVSKALAILFLIGFPLWAAPASISNPIVFVKQPPVHFTFATISDIFGNYEGYYPPQSHPTGGNLFRLDPNGQTTQLTNWTNAAVRDPEISYDGTQVLFAMKVGAFGRWQVYQMNVDGTQCTRLSRTDLYHDLDPSYLPDGRIVFTTDRSRWSDGYENLPSAQLAVMNLDGSGVEVLKQHMAGQFNPLVGSDGMLYFTQWDFHDRRDSIGQNNSNFDVNRFLLWKLFVDGSGLDHPTFGAHTIYDFAGGYVEIRELPAEPGNFLGVLADEFSTYGAGSLVRIEPQFNQNHDHPIFLTADVFGVGSANNAGRWRSPYPLEDGRIVAAYSIGPVFNDHAPLPHFDLVVLNGNGSGQQTLYHDADLWSWQPVEVVARLAPAQAPGETEPQYPYAIINAMDVTLRGRNGPQVLNGDWQPIPAPGEIQQVRVLRENLRSPNYYANDFPLYADPDVEEIGTAPVQSDGSFAVVVPTRTPLQWELLDGAGNVIVRERFGTELEAGEIRQCGGCHTPHDGRTGSTTNLALSQPTNLSGRNVDLNGNGIVDLLEGSVGQSIFTDGFESGDMSRWTAEQ